jgi:hypothetical protein
VSDKVQGSTDSMDAKGFEITKDLKHRKSICLSQWLFSFSDEEVIECTEQSQLNTRK